MADAKLGAKKNGPSSTPARGEKDSQKEMAIKLHEALIAKNTADALRLIKSTPLDVNLNYQHQTAMSLALANCVDGEKGEDNYQGEAKQIFEELLNRNDLQFQYNYTNRQNEEDQFDILVQTVLNIKNPAATLAVLIAMERFDQEDRKIYRSKGRALHSASRLDRAEVTKTLLMRGADPNYKENYPHLPPGIRLQPMSLHQATAAGKMENVKELLKSPDLDIQGLRDAVIVAEAHSHHAIGRLLAFVLVIKETINEMLAPPTEKSNANKLDKMRILVRHLDELLHTAHRVRPINMILPIIGEVFTIIEMSYQLDQPLDKQNAIGMKSYELETKRDAVRGVLSAVDIYLGVGLSKEDKAKTGHKFDEKWQEDLFTLAAGKKDDNHRERRMTYLNLLMDAALRKNIEEPESGTKSAKQDVYFEERYERTGGIRKAAYTALKNNAESERLSKPEKLRIYQLAAAEYCQPLFFKGRKKDEVSDTGKKINKKIKKYTDAVRAAEADNGVVSSRRRGSSS